MFSGSLSVLGAARLNRAAAVIIFAVAVVAIAIIAAWIFRLSAILAVIPGVRMVFNTAAGFLIAALALAAFALPRSRRVAVQTILGALIAVGFAAILAQHLLAIDLGIDGRALHDWLPDPNPAAGRAAVLTCAMFIAFSLALVTTSRAQTRRAGLAARALFVLITASGALTLVAVLLELDAMFDIFWFRRVSPLTALGFVAIGSAGFILAGTTEATRMTDEQRVVAAGTLIAMLAAVAAGISGIVIVKGSAEQTQVESLASTFASRSEIFAYIIRDRTAIFETAARDPNVGRLHWEIQLNPQDRESIDLVRTTAEHLITEGLTFVEYRDHAGKRIFSTGAEASPEAFVLPLPGAFERSLIWDDRLLLRMDIPVRYRGVAVGYLRGEQPLTDLQRTVFSFDGLGTTGELAVCGAMAEGFMSCLPTRFRPMPFMLKRLDAGMASPLSLVLDGQRGAGRSRDRQDHDVVAAYGPIGDLKLAMVVQARTNELYAGVRERLVYAAALILFLVAVAARLLHTRVRPLVRRLVMSEENARRLAYEQQTERAMLRAVIDTVPLSVFAKDRQHRFILSNKVNQRLLGAASEDELKGKSFDDFYPPDVARPVREEEDRIMGSGEPLLNRERILTSEGKARTIVASKVPLHDATGRITGIVGVSRDITEQRAMERALQESEERLKFALEGSRFALWDWNRATGTVSLSEQWQEMRGGPPEAMTVRPSELAKLMHRDDLPAVKAHLNEVLAGKVSHYDVEHRILMVSGEWLWVRSRGRVVQRDARGRPLRLVGTHANVHRRKQAELMLEHQAGHDALTGMPNRHLLQDRLTRAIARTQRSGKLMAVMYLDVDRFKTINDTLGHDVGDALLRSFAQRLATCVRTTDTVARLGGDEFFVILEDLAARDDGRQIAEKIVLEMRHTFNLDRCALEITTSVGLAFYEGEDPIAPEALIKMADEALYAAKRAGRNNYRIA